MDAKRLFAVSGLAAALLLAGGSAVAKTFKFTGTVTSCTRTCKSFAFLGKDPKDPADEWSQLNGFLEFDDDAIADGEWTGADITNLSLEVFDPAKPIIVSDPADPVSDNPFTIDQTPDGGGIVVAFGQTITNPRGEFGPCEPGETVDCVQISAGTTDGIVLTSGFVDLWLTAGLLAKDGSVIHIDLDNSTFTVTIFQNADFAAGGDIAPVVSDTDDDGLADNVDNCVNDVNPDQRDTNDDGIGNACDADFDDDCNVNFLDLGIMKSAFFSPGATDTDMNGDEQTNFLDLGLLKGDFFLEPGPSGLPNDCSP